MSFQQLRNRCKELALEPCFGKGITKAVLERKIAEYELGSSLILINDSERKVAEHDRSFYLAVKDIIPLVPDLRPKHTIEKMKLEPQDSWGRLLDELVALGRDDASEEQHLLDAINDGSDKSLLPFINKKELIERFFENYPVTTFIAKRSGSSINKLLTIIGRIEEIENEGITKDLIPFIDDYESAKKMVERDSSLIVVSENELHKSTSFRGGKGMDKGKAYYIFASLIQSKRLSLPDRLENALIIGDINLTNIFLRELINTDKDAAQIIIHQMMPILGMRGYLDLIKVVMTICDEFSISYDIWATVWGAAVSNQVKVMKYLIKLYDEKNPSNITNLRQMILKTATKGGSVDVLQFILPSHEYNFDPYDIIHEALEGLEKSNIDKVLSILLNDKRFVNEDEVEQIVAYDISHKTSHSKTILDSPHVSKALKLTVSLILASTNGNIDKIKELLAAGADFTFLDDIALHVAKNEETLSKFYGVVDTDAVLKSAIRKGYISLIKQIVKDNKVILDADANIGKIYRSYDLLKLLISLKIDDQFVYQIIAGTTIDLKQSEAEKLIAMLITNTEFDPNYENNNLIKMFARKRYYRVLKLFLDDKRVIKTLNKPLYKKYKALVEKK